MDLRIFFYLKWWQTFLFGEPFNRGAVLHGIRIPKTFLIWYHWTTKSQSRVGKRKDLWLDRQEVYPIQPDTHGEWDLRAGLGIYHVAANVHYELVRTCRR